MKVYLAGPMRNYPEFNFPAFHDAAAKLRAAGYEVCSPAEHDNNQGFDPTGMKGEVSELGPSGFNLGKALAWDLTYICTEADAVVVLPGWEDSDGANAEVRAANAVGKPVMPLATALLNAALGFAAEHSGCRNCDGRKCMDCVTGTVHDKCQPDCPFCCPGYLAVARETREPEPEQDSPRAASLKRALSYVTGDRNNAYGPPTQDFERTADLWTAFGFRFVPHKGACTCGGAQPIVPHHIANAQILLKQSRLAWQPEKPDSWDDTSGYAGCGHECVVAEQEAS